VSIILNAESPAQQKVRVLEQAMGTPDNCKSRITAFGEKFDRI